MCAYWTESCPLGTALRKPGSPHLAVDSGQQGRFLPTGRNQPVVSYLSDDPIDRLCNNMISGDQPCLPWFADWREYQHFPEFVKSQVARVQPSVSDPVARGGA